MTRQKIVITFEYPPIPVRGFDWRAGFYGCEEDGKDGFGITPIIALAELLQNYECYDGKGNLKQPRESETL